MSGMAKLNSQLSKARYFTHSLVQRVSSPHFRCPNCGSDRSRTVDTKYFVTALRRCEACRIMFRIPTDPEEYSIRYYQRTYDQGFTTRPPSEQALRELQSNGFEGSDGSYAAYLGVLRELGLANGSHLFEFGCSWGYGSWQLARAGYRVSSFEISVPRCEYARDKLGIDCTSDSGGLNRLSGDFDCFFSAHVIEHVPQPNQVVELARRLLRRGGLFVAITPNGSAARKQADFVQWHKSWGEVHPNLIDEEFYRTTFDQEQIYLDSTPFDTGLLNRFANGESVSKVPLPGGELLCVARLAHGPD